MTTCRPAGTGAHQALEELREVITVLRQDPADTDPNRPPGPGLADLPRLIDESRAAGVTVHVEDCTGPDAEVPPALGRTAYRIVQEALTNARKHAAGQPVTLALAGAPGEQLTVAVRNPVGQDHAVLPGAGTGLVGLTERVGLAGGRLDHQLSADGEFRLQAWLPWPA
jgi:signal transduction histidine kinase